MGNSSKTEVSGEELYQLFANGDECAFEKLVELYEHELALFFLRNFVHDSDEAKFLVIETFAQLVISKGQFAGKSSLKTYIFTIGKNLAFRYLKMRKREQHVSFDEISETVSGGETPDTLVERDENSRQLHKAMRGLKKEYRVVLELLHFQGMSYLEAGEIMNKSEKQITNLAYRAKAALKKSLEKDGFEY